VSDCLFCKIVAGEIDADVVTSTESVTAFRDINPQAKTHVLVIPNDHVASADELSSAHGEVLGEIFQTIAEIASAEGLDSGYRVVTNIGADAGQSVDHLHFHLLGGRSMGWPPWPQG
jgi:histidine triad (HIT) family protein